MKKILTGLTLVLSVQIMAQDSTGGSLTISGYTEAYYQYDFNKPGDNNRPGFIYSHNRHNEFNLNLGFIKANYTAERVRANLALATGTYMNANYAAEPGVLKNIYEANAGVKISQKKNLWIDAGIFGSHIGFESAISKDCWNPTRSMLADNSPYFEAGAKITYTTDNGKWMLSGLALNGWQRITRVSGNSLMSWGAQVQFKPSSKVLLNYSNFIGTDKPDSARLSRFFHNIYGIFNITDKFGITAGFDIGTEEKFPGSDNKNSWYSPVLILKYAFNNKWAIAGRVEHYNDKNGVIIATGSPNGFQTTGYSLNIDHSPFKNVLVRLEARNLSSKDEIFTKGSGSATNNSPFITSSIAVSF
jgi:Putative beta-barrel porin-2, OmpL-like. bbp2